MNRFCTRSLLSQSRSIGMLPMIAAPPQPPDGDQQQQQQQQQELPSIALATSQHLQEQQAALLAAASAEQPGHLQHHQQQQQQQQQEAHALPAEGLSSAGPSSARPAGSSVPHSSMSSPQPPAEDPVAEAVSDAQPSGALKRGRPSPQPRSPDSSLGIGLLASPLDTAGQLQAGIRPGSSTVDLAAQSGDAGNPYAPLLDELLSWAGK